MEHLEDLQSGSSPRAKKAANRIIKNKLAGYCDQLIDTLTVEMKKPRAWEAQCRLIRAIGVRKCGKALPYLRELLEGDYPNTTVLYRELAYVIAIMENISTDNLDFFCESLEKGNMMQLNGVCAALLHKQIVPASKDIRKIMDGVEPLIEDEKLVYTPRCYIAGLAYWWPIEEVREFLEACQKSPSGLLVEVATDALKWKKTKVVLF